MRLALLTNLLPPDVHGRYPCLAADLGALPPARGCLAEALLTGRPRRADPETVHRRLHVVRRFGTAEGLVGWRRHLRLGGPRARATAGSIGARGPWDGGPVSSLRRLGPVPADARTALGEPVTTRRPVPSGRAAGARRGEPGRHEAALEAQAPSAEEKGA